MVASAGCARTRTRWGTPVSPRRPWLPCDMDAEVFFDVVQAWGNGLPGGSGRGDLSAGRDCHSVTAYYCPGPVVRRDGASGRCRCRRGTLGFLCGPDLLEGGFVDPAPGGCEEPVIFSFGPIGSAASAGLKSPPLRQVRDDGSND